MSKDRQKISGVYHNRERQAAACVCVLLHDRRRILESGGGVKDWGCECGGWVRAIQDETAFAPLYQIH